MKPILCVLLFSTGLAAQSFIVTPAKSAATDTTVHIEYKADPAFRTDGRDAGCYWRVHATAPGEKLISSQCASFDYDLGGEGEYIISLTANGRQEKYKDLFSVEQKTIAHKIKISPRVTSD